jgi:anaerobic selenocysteine-containing dehydrogenase
MIHVIITDELYDREFVEAYTLGFDQLKDHVKGYGPQWAEGLTGIPAQTIRTLARAYATTRPAAIYEGNGLDMYTSGVDAVRTIAMLISLTGNLDAKRGSSGLISDGGILQTERPASIFSPMMNALIPCRVERPTGASHATSRKSDVFPDQRQ